MPTFDVWYTLRVTETQREYIHEIVRFHQENSLDPQTGGAIIRSVLMREYDSIQKYKRQKELDNERSE